MQSLSLARNGCQFAVELCKISLFVLQVYIFLVAALKERQ